MSLDVVSAMTQVSILFWDVFLGWQNLKS
jgi:hypothetical protein